MIALAFVLRLKADYHARREALVADIMRRLTNPAFPPELLLTVIEAATGSQAFYWKPPEDHTLDMLAESFFQWPRGVDSDSRIVLRQTVANVLLKAFLVKLSLRLATQSTLMIPLSLNGNSIRVRRLVVEPYHIGVSTVGDLEGLEWGIRSVEVLKASFPRLETCICLLRPGSFWGARKTSPRMKDAEVKKGLAQFVAAFLRSGPGRRKLIRCGAVAPLVESSHHEASGDASLELDVVENVNGEDSFASSAERIVERAHTFYRRPVW